ncbi:hypothetical protein SAMN05444921_106270 [Streptomyces wuyuanensis]|uniref:Uncharacterized protein n=1 Tax=Streptomyces wuyuanensis TaxID=1196353 RepID=A0A1G9S953_9ACTN|nr:hypothetical protein SAMN05444921_106270 [Streptomyces wuyuanensis]
MFEPVAPHRRRKVTPFRTAVILGGPSTTDDRVLSAAPLTGAGARVPTGDGAAPKDLTGHPAEPRWPEREVRRRRPAGATYQG